MKLIIKILTPLENLPKAILDIINIEALKKIKRIEIKILIILN